MAFTRVLLTLFMLSLAASAGAQPKPAAHAGAAACAACHAAQTAQWARSHHAQAMQPATPETVLGDFADAVLTHFGRTTRFLRNGDAFVVRTDGPGGTVADFPVAYTLGAYPLQQYLVALPGGRLQALGIAWDARGKDAGGQRWYHLYPDQNLAAGDRLHWTGRDQTVNFMCADCHTTGLRKNFDLTANSYATAWAEPGVACEACHGPGTRHIAWATGQAREIGDDLRRGIVNWLRADGATWDMQAATGIARRSAPPSSTAALDTCAGCHALRSTITPDPQAGNRFLDDFAPVLLDPGQFHADGQIDGETFEYGAFTQSRMFRAGVTCTDCHDPHAGGLRAAGNAVCAACHLPAKFDTTAHHHHKPDSAGGQCAACHMPTKTYMGVDVRHDHSFRIPRPDQTVAIGTPNACTSCHAGQPAEWAAQAVAGWYPQGRQARPHFGAALHAGRVSALDAEQRLNALIMDPTQPGIARATALAMLPRLATGASLPAWRAALIDADPLVRLGAVRGMPPALTAGMAQAAAPLLADPVRAVRIEAARALAGSPQMLPAERRAAFGAALAELRAAELANADRPESHLNLGMLAARQGQAAEADAAYRTALRLDPRFVPAMVNLADLDRALGRGPQSTNWLRMALLAEPGNADARHALGLALVREKRVEEALAELRRAAEFAPGNPRYAYVLAIALNATGAPREALAVLEASRARAPGNRETLTALATISRDNGDIAAAIGYARQLVAAGPNDPAALSLLRSLEATR